MMIYDDDLILSNVYMRKQIDGAKLCKLVSKRKKLPGKPLHIWKYNMKRQNDIFSEPLVHEMCSDLRNTYKAELPRTNEIPQQQAAGLGPNEIPQQQADGFDLNEIPQEEEEAGLVAPEEEVGLVAPEEEAGLVAPEEEEVGLGPNEIPQQQAAGFDLNEIPQEEEEAGLVAPEEEAGLVAPEEEEAGLDAPEEEEEAGLGQQQAAGFDLNEIPQEEEEAGLVAPEEEEEEVGLDAPQEEVVRPKPELTNEERFGLYFALEVIRERDGKVDLTDKQLIAVMLNTSVRTVERYWNLALAQKARNEPVDLSNKKKGNVGRKKKELDLERTADVPLNRRRTIRGLARALGVSKSTLHRRFLLGHLNRHSSRLRPAMTLANKLKRLEFCVSKLDKEWSTTDRPVLQLMDNVVHIDEKWFYMTKVKNNYYLLPDESRPSRSVHNKNNIGKVMFLTAVAKPRYGEGGVVTFDGKIGTWAFVEEVAAKKKSRNRDKGTLELKSLRVNRQVMREFLCEKVIPAIQDRWPDEDVGRTIFIQQDNAKPHLLADDDVFRQVVAATDLDIQLTNQPPNSPDMNILDLSFFRSLESHTDEHAPTTIKELIDSVEEEYNKYDVDTLARSFLTLQYCMIGVMEDGGGISYELDHKHKEQRQREGRLPIALHIKPELLAKTNALIAKMKLEIDAKNTRFADFEF